MQELKSSKSKDIKQGDIFSLNGTDCVVLDTHENEAFCITKDVITEAIFDKSGKYRGYSNSDIKLIVDNWGNNNNVSTTLLDMNGYLKYHIFMPTPSNEWWLDTPAEPIEANSERAMTVTTEGYLNPAGNCVNYMKYGVRPAFWIDVDDITIK